MQDFELFEADEDGDNSWGRKGNLAGTDSKRSSDQHVGRTEGREKEIVAKGAFQAGSKVRVSTAIHYLKQTCQEAEVKRKLSQTYLEVKKKCATPQHEFVRLREFVGQNLLTQATLMYSSTSATTKQVADTPQDEVCATNKSVNASGAGSIQKMQSLHTTAMVVKDSDKEDVSQEAADILTTVGIDPDEEAKLLLQKEAVPPAEQARNRSILLVLIGFYTLKTSQFMLC